MDTLVCLFGPASLVTVAMSINISILTLSPAPLIWQILTFYSDEFVQTMYSHKIK